MARKKKHPNQHPEQPKMSQREFDRRVNALGGSKSASLSAVRGVLVEGMTYDAACLKYQGQPGVTCRLVQRIRRLAYCRCCGQEVKKDHDLYNR